MDYDSLPEKQLVVVQLLMEHHKDLVEHQDNKEALIMMLKAIAGLNDVRLLIILQMLYINTATIFIKISSCLEIIVMGQ